MTSETPGQITLNTTTIGHKSEALTGLVIQELKLPPQEVRSLMLNALNVSRNTPPEEIQRAREQLEQYYGSDSSVVLRDAANDLADTELEQIGVIVTNQTLEEGYTKALRCRTSDREIATVGFTASDTEIAFRNGVRTDLQTQWTNLQKSLEAAARLGQTPQMVPQKEDFIDTVLQTSGIIPFHSKSKMEIFLRLGRSTTVPPQTAPRIIF